MLESRRVVCGHRTYILKRFEDHTIAICDEQHKQLAGWPLTAPWPNDPLEGQSDAGLCELIHKLLRPS